MLTPPLHQLHDDFIAECRYLARLSGATIRNYQTTFHLLSTLAPELDLRSLTSNTMMRFFRELETRQRCVGRGRYRQGVKATTIATYRAKLCPFFNWLKDKGYISASPFEHLPQPKIIYDEPQYLRKSQLDKILTAIDVTIPWANLFIQKRNAAVIIMFICTGLRRSELLNIRTHDLDIERGELRVSASTSKSKHHRTLPLNFLASRRLTDYLEERRKRGITHPFLFSREDCDQPFTADCLKRLIKRICTASGVSFHVHQLRHTFAVNLISSGSDVAVVQKLMGHKNITSTLTYLRCIPSPTMRQSVDALDWDKLV